MAPKAVAAKVTPNDNPTANPIEGAKNVLITDAKTIESIFQNTLPALVRHDQQGRVAGAFYLQTDFVRRTVCRTDNTKTKTSSYALRGYGGQEGKTKQ